ncbi:MAG: hypothetical protein QOJ60_737, partial [Actinomycetota bacterium]|nr:hypothetical protein [Actinomycetota bacterium]
MTGRAATRALRAAGTALALLALASCSSTDATTPAAGATRAETATTSAPAVSSTPPHRRRPRPSSTPVSVMIRHAGSRTALALLRGLTVKGRAPMTGYDRLRFGPAWTDTDRNGCDTRDDVLRRDLVRRHVEAGTDGCVILSGRLWPDPYTGHRISFVRGGASEVDIDHVVALGDAWQKGAFRWPFRKRLALANDPLNLLAVDASANRSKGDADAASWLPDNKAYRCAYVARQVAVKAKYDLWVTLAEREAMGRVLARCPERRAPHGDAPTIAAVAGVSDGSSSGGSASGAGTSAGSGSGLDPRFSYCYEAIAAGYGPYVRGRDQEYSWYTDADSDGVVC